MAIKVGDRLPAGVLWEFVEEGEAVEVGEEMDGTEDWEP